MVVDEKYINDVIFVLKTGFTIQTDARTFDVWQRIHHYYYLKETKHMDLYINDTNNEVMYSAWDYLKDKNLTHGTVPLTQNMCLWTFNLDEFRDYYANIILDGSELDACK